jgi:hypothetical protein
MYDRLILDPTTKFSERCKVSNRLDGLTPRYTIAPTQDVPDPQELTPLLHPSTIRPLDFYKVSKAVHRAGYASPECMQQAVEGIDARSMAL